MASTRGASIAEGFWGCNDLKPYLSGLVVLLRHRRSLFRIGPHTTKSLFFSFEGIDGSGKSTQARLLAETLREHGHKVVEVREPGGTALGESIRGLLLDPSRQIDEKAELLLFSAARAQLVSAVIRPALAQGAVVIADRFYDSSTAYQGGGRGVATPSVMGSLHQFATDGLAPDRTYLVDVPLYVAASRRGQRELDRMERGGDAFFERVRDSYHELAPLDRFMVVDGTLSVEELRAQIESDALSIVAND